jgi:hypothetical protein
MTYENFTKIRIDLDFKKQLRIDFVGKILTNIKNTYGLEVDEIYKILANQSTLNN